jgi:hypothetical protein
MEFMTHELDTVHDHALEVRTHARYTLFYFYAPCVSVHLLLYSVPLGLYKRSFLHFFTLPSSPLFPYLPFLRLSLYPPFLDSLSLQSLPPSLSRILTFHFFPLSYLTIATVQRHCGHRLECTASALLATFCENNSNHLAQLLSSALFKDVSYVKGEEGEGQGQGKKRKAEHSGLVVRSILFKRLLEHSIHPMHSIQLVKFVVH